MSQSQLQPQYGKYRKTSSIFRGYGYLNLLSKRKLYLSAAVHNLWQKMKRFALLASFVNSTPLAIQYQPDTCPFSKILSFEAVHNHLI